MKANDEPKIVFVRISVSTFSASGVCTGSASYESPCSVFSILSVPLVVRENL